MAKISKYPNGGALQSSDQVVVARSGKNYNILGSSIGGGGGSGGGNPDGVMLNGKISVAVASNNITVSIKTLAGTDPSSSDKVYITIGSTVREISSALSVTVNAGVNTFNSGSSELATKEVDYFVYLTWLSASSAVGIGFARISHGTVYSNFSGTATNEKYAAFSTAPASTDNVVVIGRFAATLSAGAGYTWTVPTFTTSNLIQRPIFQTRWLTWVPQWTASGTMTITSVVMSHALYQISNDMVMIDFILSSSTLGGTANSQLNLTIPLSAYLTDYPLVSVGLHVDTVGFGMGHIRIDGANVGRMRYQKSDGSNFGLGSLTYVEGRGSYILL